MYPSMYGFQQERDWFWIVINGLDMPGGEYSWNWLALLTEWEGTLRDRDREMIDFSSGRPHPDNAALGKALFEASL
jgi:hypothetical protein